MPRLSHHYHIASETLYPNIQSLVLSVSHYCEPSSYDEAAMDPAWQKAMTQELNALYDNNSWDLVPIPVSKKAIWCKWLYKIKHRADGILKGINQG